MQKRCLLAYWLFLGYNGGMNSKIPFIFVLVFLIGSCASVPVIEIPQFTRQYYSFSILHTPEKPSDSHQLKLTMFLMKMNYPEEQAAFFNQIIYSAKTLEEYKDRLIIEQRNSYRKKSPVTAVGAKNVNWRYSETIDVIESADWVETTEAVHEKTVQNHGIIVRRITDIYPGENNAGKSTRYFVLDMDGLTHIKIDALFANFQGDRRLRDLIYEELRKKTGLERGKSLSDGIFFSSEPELTFNFYFTKTGLGFHWDANQIAPLSNGDIEIILPWQTVRPLIQAGGIQILTKFNIHLFV